MYYDRVLSSNFAQLLKIGGELNWLFELVKKRSDLDLANKQKYAAAIEIITDALVMVKYSNLSYPLVHFINMYCKEWQRVTSHEKDQAFDMVGFYKTFFGG